MNKLFITGLLFVFLCDSCTFLNKESVKEINNGKDRIEENQDHLIMSVLWYQRSAEMQAAYYQAFNWAERIVIEKIETVDEKNPKAVILDIDETVLDNSSYEAQLIFEMEPYSSKSWKKWVSKSVSNPLPGALKFTKLADSLGVEVFYISNRENVLLESTIDNLRKEGFPNSDKKHIFLRTDESSKKERWAKVSSNYDILLFIGDNLEDFSEIFESRDNVSEFIALKSLKNEFGSRFIILPNPMYGSWEKPFLGTDDNYEEKKEKLKQNLILK
ncbi:MAG: 5'-nucleotidase, lipoprotein e(P4) family [Bacteroidetes bacterium]|nr:5'-nucleotidase, lipoprotein e(P4) family [Bacteroidota bacterium]